MTIPLDGHQFSAYFWFSVSGMLATDAMIRHDKWIHCRPDDSVLRIARRVLRSRLQRVWQYLDLTASQPVTESENVHQLRVFSRRATAALEIFEPWIPPRRGKWIVRQVKRIRRAAGEARDLDVLWMRWTHCGPHLSARQSKLLLSHICNLRHQAQKPIQRMHKKMYRERFDKRVDKMLKHLMNRSDDAKSDEAFVMMARRSLRNFVTPYLAMSDGPMSNPKALHLFRIQGKRVRYAMEIFAGAFEAEFRSELYPIVAAIQERLGSVNDLKTADDYLSQWHANAKSNLLREALSTAHSQEHRSLTEAQQKFLDWWTPQRRAELRSCFATFMPAEALHLSTSDPVIPDQ